MLFHSSLFELGASSFGLRPPQDDPTRRPHKTTGQDAEQAGAFDFGFWISDFGFEKATDERFDFGLIQLRIADCGFNKSEYRILNPPPADCKQGIMNPPPADKCRSKGFYLS
jgi:hypothetical protein